MLGWSHGVGWILLCIAVGVGCRRRCFPWPLLAATVSPLGPVGSTIGLEYLARSRDRAAAQPGSLAAAMFPLNLPNVLTLLRILLVPVLVVALTEEIDNGSDDRRRGVRARRAHRRARRLHRALARSRSPRSAR